MLLLLALPAKAYIGNSGSFIQTAVGPYSVVLAAHPPATVPGTLQLNLRFTAFSPGAHITSGTAALDDATPAPLQLSADATAVANLPVATSSAHVLHLTLRGTRGQGAVTIPLPRLAAMPALLASPHLLRQALLLASLLLLVAALIALYRGRQSSPAEAASETEPPHWTMTRVAMALFVACFALTAIAIAAGAARPHTMLRTELSPGGRLDLTLFNPEETFADLTPEHGKLLHLFLIREPEEDVLLHLHPRQTGPGQFTVQLPPMPPGQYATFADLSYREPRTGVTVANEPTGGDEPAARNEIATTTLDLPQQDLPSRQQHAAAADPDDSFALLPALSRSSAAASADDTSSLQSVIAAQTSGAPPATGSFISAPQNRAAPPPADVPLPGYANNPLESAVSLTAGSQFAVRTAVLADGYTMQLRSPAQLKPMEANLLEVTLLAPGGAPPANMQLYLGMTAHAIVLRTGPAGTATPLSVRPDDQVFDHIHSGGTLPMPAPAAAPGSRPPVASMPAPSNIAPIPYGFPSAGRYRIFVQMKHDGQVETGAFDVVVD